MKISNIITTISIISFVLIIFISGYMLREYIGNKCEEKCYDYCDTASEGITTIINKLNGNIFEDVE